MTNLLQTSYLKNCEGVFALFYLLKFKWVGHQGYIRIRTGLKDQRALRKILIDHPSNRSSHWRHEL